MTAVTVSVSWEGGRDGHWMVEVLPTGGEPVRYPMAARRDEEGVDWPVPGPGDGADLEQAYQEFRLLAKAVASRTATVQEAAAYGRYLFAALLDPGWAAVDKPPPAGGPLVVQLRWAPGALHRFAWELMHDGQGYLALRTVTPVVFVRLAGPEDAAGPAPITRPPHVLFAVGCALDDWRVQAGAEIMGVMREVERGASLQGSAVLARVLTSASLAKLRAAAAAFEPDVVHLIGHGRWDGERGLGVLTLALDSAVRGEQAADGSEHSAAEIAAALSTPGRIAPTMVVVSACDSGVASTAAGLPLGAELAAAGIPIVIAMAGEISDTTCRIFTRSVVASAARGKDLTEALAAGRYAAFAYANGTPDKVDWALPAIFLRAPLPDGFVLADTTAVSAVREVIERQLDVAFPLFAGRPELLDDLDELLGPGNPGALVLHSTYQQRIGGTRALQELAAESVRKGHLAVRIGPFTSTDDAPTTFPELARNIATALISIAKRHGADRPRRTLLLLTGHDPSQAGGAPDANQLLSLPLTSPPKSADWLVEELRTDVFALRNALAVRRPDVFTVGAAPVLLLDDVHLYTDGLAQLLAQLKRTGLGDGEENLPIVLFAKEHEKSGGEVARFRDLFEGHGHVKFRELVHVTMLTGGNDRLALLSWMLNPPRGIPSWDKRTVLAPNGSAVPGVWLGAFRMAMRGLDFYDPGGYAEFTEWGLQEDGPLVESDDDRILSAYGLLS